jgi:hypothetical protein
MEFKQVRRYSMIEIDAFNGLATPMPGYLVKECDLGYKR